MFQMSLQIYKYWGHVENVMNKPESGFSSAGTRPWMSSPDFGPTRSSTWRDSLLLPPSPALITPLAPQIWIHRDILSYASRHGIYDTMGIHKDGPVTRSIVSARFANVLNGYVLLLVASFLICFLPLHSLLPLLIVAQLHLQAASPSKALGTPRAFGDGDPNKGIWFLGHIGWLLLVKDIHLFLKRLCAACDLPSVLTLVDH
ncbi:MAG: hypothetical protein J3Q66DRAFT_375456 [Benniella sp.]|nr:MAG: hypothetical protein J3Q66DRAFT_375456 [Benniella sp.]